MNDPFFHDACEGVAWSSDMGLIRVDAPVWYAREDFLEWLDTDGTATWHVKGSPPTEYSDVFVTFDQGDGSDSPVSTMAPAIPEDIWEELCKIVSAAGLDECLLWIRNLEA